MDDTDLGFTVSPVRRELPQDHPAEPAEFFASGAEFQLVVAERALNGMRRQAGNSPDKEIGGILVGRHYRVADRFLVAVEDHVAVPSRSSGIIHFEFDESSIQAIHQRLDDRPDQYVVGLYHSHVGGVPFMSVMDDDLHRGHLRQPWHVSCVVSAGSWGRTAGFWRMQHGKLVEITKYAVAMSEPGDDPEERHLRFLSACGVNEPTLLRPRIASVLPALGIDDSGPLAEAIAGVAGTWEHAEGMADVLFLISVAKAASADPDAVAELDAMERRVQQLRLFEDIVTPVMPTGVFNERMSVQGDECYAYSVRSSRLARLDIDKGVAIPVRVVSKSVSVAHAPDGHAWVLTASRRLIRMPVLDTTRWLNGDHTFQVAAVELPKVPSRLQQLVVTGTHVWLRAVAEWHRIPYRICDDGITLEPAESGPLPVSDCLLVPSNGLEAPDAGPLLIANDGGVLTTWTMEGSSWVLTQADPLPSPWRDHELLQACCNGLGWYLLFREGVRERLCLFDRDSRELIYHAIRPPEDEILMPITAICGNGAGQVFAQAGGVLYRA